MKKKAIITGINGQDGAYLAKLLLEKGYKVYGADRRRVDAFQWRSKELGIRNEVEFLYLDLLEYSNIFDAIKKTRPDEIYNLAAQSFVGASFYQPILTANVDAIGPLRILDSIKTIDPTIKFYQASTSEMFGKAQETPQTEQSPFHPRSPYGVSKLFAHWAVKNYRESYNIFATSGILFNHESPLRGIEFVTKKITNHVANHSLGLENVLVLGNLSAYRDWGYAKEYVKGMYLMMQQDYSDEYILATGESHSIRDFVTKAFHYIGVNIIWDGSGINEVGLDSISGKKLIKVSDKFFRPAEVEHLLGDFTKAKEKLDWQPETSLDELIKIMVDYDIKHNKMAM